MTSEIRTNSLKSRAGMSTVTMTDSGPMFSGITTFVDNSGFTFGVGGGTSIFTPATNVLTFGTNNTEKIRIDASGHMHGVGVITATHFYGDGSNLTGITGTTINNNADNRVITGSGTANTLNGESGLTYNGSTLGLAGSLAMTGGSISLDSHPLIGTANFTDISGGSYAARLGSTGSSTIRSTQIYGGGNHLATFDGVNGRLGINITTPVSILHLHEAGSNGDPIIQFSNGDTGTTTGDGFAIGLADDESPFIYNRENTALRIGTNNLERLRIASNGSVGVNISNPQVYDPGARALVVGEVDGYGHTGLTIKSNGTDKQGAIYFADGTGSASYRGRVEYRHDTDTLGLGAGGTGYMYELTSDRHLQSGNLCINTAVHNSSSTKYSQINSDNHGNTFFGLNCRLGTTGSSGNHRIIQSNSHGTIGCAGILMGGNGSNNNSHIAFFAFGQGNSAGHDFGQDAWKVRIKRSGDVMEVKTTQNSGNAGMIVFRDGNNDYCGQITSNGASNTSNFVNNSDYRLKTNVSSITDGITRVKNLKPYQFEWKSDLGTKVDGFFAHEAQTVVPESVVGTKDEVDSDGKPKYQGIDQAKLVPVLTASIKELIAKVESLEEQNIALRVRVTNLEGN